jgi:ABC-type transporter Mla MlaB component
MTMAGIKSKALGNETTLRIVGNLNGQTVFELERCWRKARSSGQQVQLDLCSVDKIDDAGKTLLTYMFGSGVELLVKARKHKVQHHVTVFG